MFSARVMLIFPFCLRCGFLPMFLQGMFDSWQDSSKNVFYGFEEAHCNEERTGRQSSPRLI